jgi:hypothetical protein
MNALRKLPITVLDLKEVKIGKKVQMLKKFFERDSLCAIG